MIILKAEKIKGSLSYGRENVVEKVLPDHFLKSQN